MGWNMFAPKKLKSMVYSFPHNHGSGKWLYLKGNYYWRDPVFTSMIMGGSVIIVVMVPLSWED